MALSGRALQRITRKTYAQLEDHKGRSAAERLRGHSSAAVPRVVFTPRHRWLIQKVASAFTIDASEVEHLLRVDDGANYRMVQRLFKGDPDVPKLFIYRQVRHYPPTPPPRGLPNGPLRF